MPTPSEEAAAKVRDFISSVNTHYESDVAAFGGDFTALNVARFSSGVIDLDCALGGGWPFNRVSIIAGEESSGKTLAALKACAAVENYDHRTKQHRDLVDPKEFVAGTALFVDLEGSFDMVWAKQNGFNADRHVVTRPEYAEQAVDIVTRAIHENVFDLIVIDSVAAMTPTKEIEESTEDWQMGLAARIVNKAMRRWNSSLNRMSTSSACGGPAVICLNQFRIDLGKQFGDPRTMPGGKGQRFCASIIIYTKGTKVEVSEEEDEAFVVLGGVTQKNKTYVPHLNFKYRMALREMSGWQTGQVDNLKRMLDLGKKYDLITTVKGKTIFDGAEYKTQKALMAAVASNEETYRLLWRSIVKQATTRVV